MTREQFNKKLPDALKKARTQCKLTQLALAEATGLTATWINHFEKGRRVPDSYAFFKLDNRLNLISYLPWP